MNKYLCIAMKLWQKEGVGGGGGGVARCQKFVKREQNGLNIELEIWNLAHKPSPIGTTSKWEKNQKISFLG